MRGTVLPVHAPRHSWVAYAVRYNRKKSLKLDADVAFSEIITCCSHWLRCHGCHSGRVRPGWQTAAVIRRYHGETKKVLQTPARLWCRLARSFGINSFAVNAIYYY